MKQSDREKPRLSRRRFLSRGLMAAATTGLSAQGAPEVIAAMKQNDEQGPQGPTEPFWVPIKEAS